MQPADPSLAVEIHDASFAWMDQSKLAKLKLAREKYRQASSEKQQSVAELEMTDISKGVRYVKFLV